MKTLITHFNNGIDAINENRWLKFITLLLTLLPIFQPLVHLSYFFRGMQMPSFYWPNEILLIIFSVIVLSFLLYTSSQRKELKKYKNRYYVPLVNAAYDAELTARCKSCDTPYSFQQDPGIRTQSYFHYCPTCKVFRHCLNKERHLIDIQDAHQLALEHLGFLVNKELSLN